MDKISQLNGKYYELFYKTPSDTSAIKERSIGLIAQDVKNILPEATKLDDKDIISIDYNAIIPVIVESIKELENIIKNQNQKIEELQSRVDLLTNKQKKSKK